jgi:ABC-type polysaccharide/polyol phosphate export permease
VIASRVGVAALPAGSLRGLFRYRALVGNLVAKDLKLKYRDSLLGLFWSLLHPALMLITYVFAFKVVLRVRAENYPYFVMAGLLPWTFFASALTASTQAIVGNAGLIRKVYFPREILPLASVLFAFTQLLLALAVFLPALILISGIGVSWKMALVLPVLLLHLAFTLGLAFPLAAVTVHLRDVAHLTEVMLPILFWVTPIVYPIDMVPATLQGWMKLSPLALFALTYQDVLFRARLPEWELIAPVIGWSAATVGVGYLVFRRFSPTLAEDV